MLYEVITLGPRLPGQELGLLLQVRGVAAGEGGEAAVLELEHPGYHPVEEVAVVSSYNFV